MYGETTSLSVLWWLKLRRSRMLFDESYEQLKKQSFFHLRFFFLILMISSHQPCEWNVITPAICIYVCLSGKVSFHFLIFVFISHTIRHQCKRHVLFPKGELFVFFNFCIFIASSVSFPWIKFTLLFYEAKNLEKLVYQLLK